MKERTWLDTTTLAQMENAKEVLEKLIAEGNTLVIANTAVDVKLFQEDPDWLEDCLIRNQIVIEIWATPDEMVSKPFFWSSCNQESPVANSLKDAVKDLPNADAIMQIAELVMDYGIAKGDWPAGQWAPAEPITPATAKVLGLSENATRTEVLSAARAKNRMDLFDSYNVGYNKGIAMQHLCHNILNSDGSTTEI